MTSPLPRHAPWLRDLADTLEAGTYPDIDPARLRGAANEIERADQARHETMRTWHETVDQYRLEQARAIADQVRTIVLQPGEYAIVELPGGLDHMDEIVAAVPDEVRGRLMFAEGVVHTIPPSEESTR